MSALLIWSSSYCRNGLDADFGSLPEAFLPIGDRRLFEILADRAAASDMAVALAVPHGFLPAPFDREIIRSRGIRLITVGEGHSMDHALPVIRQLVEIYGGELRLLHGAILPDEFFDMPDLIASSESARYISVTSGELLFRCLIETTGLIGPALAEYDRTRPLTQAVLPADKRVGTRDLYLAAATHLLTPRAFNRLSIIGPNVRKSSMQTTKIAAEIYWYSNLPSELSKYVPRLLGSGVNEAEAWYEVEHVPCVPLSRPFVFGRLDDEAWHSVFVACAGWLSDSHRFRPTLSEVSQSFAKELYFQKTLRRLARFERETEISVNSEWTLNGQRLPSLAAIAVDASRSVASPTPEDVSLVHGDFCFSNILYDPSTQAIQLIDPRGIGPSGNQTMFGDRRYDIAKLHHSVIGLYDFIVADRYRLAFDGNARLEFDIPIDSRVAAIQRVFADSEFGEHTNTSATSLQMSILLFLSMLPLHAEAPRRQVAIIANALRLYVLLTKH